MDKVSVVVPKLLIVTFLLWVAWYLLTYKVREAKSHFRHIQEVRDLADRQRMILKGLVKPEPNECYILGLTEYQLERCIFALYIDNGLIEIGETEWGKYLHRLQFRRLGLSHSLEERVIYYDENQGIKTPTDEVGEGFNHE